MRTSFALRSCSVACALAVSALGCGGDHAAGTADAGVDAAVDAAIDGSSLAAVTFTFTPSWTGVSSVQVIGGFGQASDWTAPFATLTAQGSTFSGTAMLPPGQYPYLFKVVGDDAAGTKAGTFSRYALDANQMNTVACPSGAPTYSTTVMNPCSQLTAPSTGTPTLVHVTGKVVVGANPGASYLVVLEREETGSHHFFVDRMTTGADGTFDLAAAPGMYRLQIQHPQFESMTDGQLTPASLNIARRSISGAFALTTAVAIADVDMAFAGYAGMSPTTGPQTLPTTFAFSSGPKTVLDVYGTGNEIGDPWFAATSTTTGSAQFTGTFNTMQATQTTEVAGDKYWWGVELPHTDANHLAWTTQSMVFAMTWTN